MANFCNFHIQPSPDKNPTAIHGFVPPQPTRSKINVHPHSYQGHGLLEHMDGRNATQHEAQEEQQPQQHRPLLQSSRRVQKVIFAIKFHSSRTFSADWCPLRSFGIDLLQTLDRSLQIIAKFIDQHFEIRRLHPVVGIQITNPTHSACGGNKTSQRHSKTIDGPCKRC